MSTNRDSHAPKLLYGRLYDRKQRINSMWMPMVLDWDVQQVYRGTMVRCTHSFWPYSVDTTNDVCILLAIRYSEDLSHPHHSLQNAIVAWEQPQSNLGKTTSYRASSSTMRTQYRYGLHMCISHFMAICHLFLKTHTNRPTYTHLRQVCVPLSFAVLVALSNIIPHVLLHYANFQNHASLHHVHSLWTHSLQFAHIRHGYACILFCILYSLFILLHRYCLALTSMTSWYYLYVHFWNSSLDVTNNWNMKF